MKIKAFTLTLVAMLFATISFAQKPVQKGQFTPPTQKKVEFQSDKRLPALRFAGEFSSAAKNLNRAPKKASGETAVTPPASLVTEEYSVSYEDRDGNAASGAVNVGFDGNDVYIQGFSSLLPDAWVKGTLSGTTITFEADQLLGNYYGIADVYFNLQGNDVTFSYDAANNILTATDDNAFYTVYQYQGTYYNDAYYKNAVITKVIEVAATPADPSVTSLRSSNYGYIIDFDIPVVDTNNNGLVTSKLYYEIYTDVNGVITPLTFTSATHSRLTESLTEIPYGFSDNYDFYAEFIYLNELYSADWDRIGIKSIYKGGGEVHESAIGWYEILKEVTPPASLVAEAYTIVYEDNRGDAASGTVNVGFDGNDVYIQGFSNYLPDAWVKGTLSGTTVTFKAEQLLGNYNGLIDVYFNLLGDNVTFSYDAANNKLTATDVFYTLYLYQGTYYYDAYYKNAVITKVIEVAATPATPSINNLGQEQGYGYYIVFTVPTVDTEGNGLLASKLSYELYSDINGEISPLTFTPATHSRLTESLTEIPYGYTEDWDFYSNSIYFNNLFSDDWNRIGIKSIYRGGGEVHESEIAWYNLKPYTVTLTGNTVDAVDYYATYYNSENDYVADDNTTVYTAALSSDGSYLELTEVPEKEIPAGNAVLLKSSAANITLTESAVASNTLTDNVLEGSDNDQTVAAGEYLVLSAANSTVGFYKFNGTTLAAHKAYIPVSAVPASSAAKGLLFGGEATGIDAVRTSQSAVQGNAPVYNLAGQRVNANYKGIVIKNGAKSIQK